jgi:hypothetical protein
MADSKYFKKEKIKVLVERLIEEDEEYEEIVGVRYDTDSK